MTLLLWLALSSAVASPSATFIALSFQASPRHRHITNNNEPPTPFARITAIPNFGRPRSAWALRESSSSGSYEEKGGNNEDRDDSTLTPKTTQERPFFVNDGPFSWMSFYLDFAGIREGKSIAFGPIPTDIDESKRPTEAEALKLREGAARNMQNIGQDERDRRGMVARAMGIVTFLYVVWASLVLDDGGSSGHFFRFLSIIPLFLAVGFKMSADTGL
jgi:hypothetical protein